MAFLFFVNVFIYMSPSTSTVINTCYWDWPIELSPSACTPAAIFIRNRINLKHENKVRRVWIIKIERTFWEKSGWCKMYQKGGQSNPNLLKSELSNERDQIFLIFLHDFFTNMCPRNGSERVQIGLTPNDVNL